MNRLQFATLLSWTGHSGLQGRKRLQKVVFFLQQAGCPLNCRYTLHHFGPYSRDVAEICDEMVAAGLVEETCAGQYSYRLRPQIAELLNGTSAPEMNQFKKLGDRLLNENLWQLELGSTILFFFRQIGDWEVSLVEACKFKQVDSKSYQSHEALELAKQFGVPISNN